jgi:pentatricopeptide repeat protein
MNEEDNDLAFAVSEVSAATGNIVELMKAAGLDPKADFRGGDWRGCDFRDLNLAGCNFRGARVFTAKFAGANVKGADFRDTEVWLTDFKKARNWESARLQQVQRDLLLAHDENRPWKSGRPRSLDARYYNELIMNAEGYAEARGLFERMIEVGCSPDRYTFTALIDKALTEEIALNVFSEARTYEIQPDAPLFNALADKMPTYEKARAIFERMIAEGLSPTNYDYNVLLKRSGSFDMALLLFSEMRAHGLSPDAISFNNALKTTSCFDEVIELLDRMKAYGADVRADDYAAALRKTGNADEVSWILERMAQEGIPLNTNSYNALIRLSDGTARAWQIFFKMQSAEILPDRYTIYSLLNKVGDFKGALEALEVATRNDVPIDADMVTLLLRRTPDPMNSRLIRAEVEGNLGSLHDVVEALIRRWIAFRDRAEIIEKILR